MCTKSLLQELHFQEDANAEQNPEKVYSGEKLPTEMQKLLVDMMKPLDSYCISYEEVWNGMIYDECDEKNMLTSMAHHELLGLTRFRLKFLLFFIQICRNSLDYEPVKEIYKKKLQTFKQLEQGGVTPTLLPGQSSFHISQ